MATTIGPFDRRRMIHRCEQCRVSRIKCDGNRPCQACTTRCIQCQDQKQSGNKQAEIILPQPLVATPSLTSSPPTYHTRSLADYLIIARQVIGKYHSPVTEPFSTSTFLRLVWENEDIGHAVVAVGAAYLAICQPAACSPHEQGLADSIQRTLYVKIRRRFQETDCHVDSSLLPLTMLLCILQLMTAKSTNICLYLLDQVTTYVIVPRGPQGFPTEPEKSFVLLYRMLYVLGCLQRDQESAITDWEWEEATSEEGKAPHIDNCIFGSTCTVGTDLAKLNAINQAWLEDEQHVFCGSPGSDEHVKRGKAIIEQASELMKSIENLEHVLLSSAASQITISDMVFASCLCIKIGILRLFSHTPWQNDNFPRPSLQDSNIPAYAASALSCLERRIDFGGLESVIYLSHLMALVLEIRDSDGRRRIIELFRKTRRMGFTVVDVYIRDAELVWEAVLPTESRNDLDLWQYGNTCQQQ